MRKIELKNDLKIMGYGTIKKGTTFKVEDYNSRYTYVKLGLCTLKLTKKDFNIIY